MININIIINTNLMKHIIRQQHHTEVVDHHGDFHIEGRGLSVLHNLRSNKNKQ